MTAFFTVFVGAGIGGALRHAVARLNFGADAAAFPWSTLLVNITGSFAMGLLAGWFGIREANSGSQLQLLLTTGVLGGYTTFSAFSLDAVRLWQRGDVMGATLYVLGSVLLSLLGLVLGFAATRP